MIQLRKYQNNIAVQAAYKLVAFGCCYLSMECRTGKTITALSAADITILLYRPQVYNKRYPEPFQSTNPNGTALIDIAKGRNIGVFKFIAGFNAATTHFYELNERPILPLTESKDDNPF